MEVATHYVNIDTFTLVKRIYENNFRNKLASSYN